MPDNILFLMTDQHSVSTLGCYGNPVVATPALDRLDATGTRLADAFTPTANRSPARPRSLPPPRDLQPGSVQSADRGRPVPAQAAGQLRAQRRLPRGPS